MKRVVKASQPVKASATVEQVQKLYYDALAGDLSSKDYAKGVVETIEMLFECGLIKEEEFRTDL